MEATGPASAVPGFTHLPGNHCGSTALRDLLAFHGAAISEETVLGLGAGPGFYYFAIDSLSPSRITNGRTAALEAEFLALTEAPLRLRTAETPEDSWAMAAEAIDEGRPAILLTDIYHLDHYGNSAHFPGHAIVLAGYDDTHAWVADTGFEELQRTSLEGLARARHERGSYFPLSGEMIDLPRGAELDAEELRAAAPGAIARAAQRMLEPPMGENEGLPALRRLAAEVGGWSERPDWQWCARFNYQVIERRGTGGGNFRAMYAGFLAEVGNPHAPLAATAAQRWSELAAALYAASEPERPEGDRWRAVASGAGRVLEAEQGLWEALGALKLQAGLRSRAK